MWAPQGVWICQRAPPSNPVPPSPARSWWKAGSGARSASGHHANRSPRTPSNASPTSPNSSRPPSPTPNAGTNSPPRARESSPPPASPAAGSSVPRAPTPVDLDVSAEGPLPQHVETSAYYLVAEALTNTVKHAHVSAVTVTVEADTTDAALRIMVRDNGVGGADFAHGTGLTGLKDRVEALSGRILLDSPRGAGTTLRAELPLS